MKSDSNDNCIRIMDPFARQLMARYLERRGDDVQALRSALASGDFESIQNKGHNLYGSGSAYGLDRISELGAALEKTARNKNSDALGELIQQLEAFIRNVRVV